ncbi:ABC transporter permease [Sporanaerobacter acetigenes]|uniref:Iron(III) transport system permease protein n=1 Tax=Sporanaerobacter acetigenes DSM 13106 TaxID=1123281 RepID=A0A1M5YAA6_9FIRM|nr:iron ABC transporter permease [Sporanaerobacter acetigenes]SHI08977.1 iron(III) transport system permease protein [Sporanaerobacter acetigenes DSM 13106]
MNIKTKNIGTKFMKIIFYLVIFWFLIGYVLYPAVNTLITSLSNNGVFTLDYYKEFFTSNTNITALKNTLVLGFATVLVCGIIGTFLAFYVNFFDFPFRKTIHRILLTPIMLPGIIIVIAFIQLYGESGLVTKTIELLLNLDTIPYKFSGFKGILFVHAYTQYVYFYMNTSVAIKYLDYSLIESARNLGASKTKIFFTIILPMISPALIASSIITFMSGISSFSAPNLLGDTYRVMSTQILLSKANKHMEMAAVQVMILLLVSITFLLLLRYYENHNKFSTSVKGTPFKPVKIKNRIVRLIFTIICLSSIIMIILPILTIVLLSFVKPGTWMIEIFPKEFSLDNYVKIFTKKRTFLPFKNSIHMSIMASLFGLVIAVPCSYIIVKTNNKSKIAIEILSMLPWAMPASTIAINLINTFNKPNIFAFQNVLIGGYMILPLAYSISLFPLIVRSTNVALSSLSDNLEEASRSLGATWWHTFMHVTIPIITPGILSGTILGFIRSIGEYGISAFLYGVSNKPISIAMVNALYDFDIGLSMAYGVLVVILSSILTMIIMKIEDSNF